jgi:hypothetical protein
MAKKVQINGSLPVGTSVIGKVGIDQTTPGTTNLMQIGGSLPAGTNAIGKLAANNGVDIGDVDIKSIAAGDNNIGNVDIVTLPSVVLTAETTKVIGTVNVAASQTIGLAAGTAEIGKLAAGLANIGDVDVASIAAGTNLIGKVGIDQTTPGTTNGVVMNASIAEWAVTGDSAANTAQTITKAAEASNKHVVTAFEVVISGAAAGADISVALKDGDTVKWQTYIGTSAVRGERVGIVFAHGIEMTTNTAANLVVGAGGASVVTSANMAGYTK